MTSLLPSANVTKSVLPWCRIGALGWIFLASVSFGDSLELIRKIPHSGYSEGLDYHDGFLWNSLPKQLNKIDPKDGTIVAHYPPASEYSESLTWFQGYLWNVSFSDNGLYRGKIVKDELKFERVASVPEIHAWGIEHVGNLLVICGNYSNKLYYYDPKEGKFVKTLETTATDVEDLAWDGKQFWASSFTQHHGHIFTIDPKTGKMGEPQLLPLPEECPVIDGIAYDGKALWVTGKECPAIYQVKVPTERAITSKKK